MVDLSGRQGQFVVIGGLVMIALRLLLFGGESASGEWGGKTRQGKGQQSQPEKKARTESSRMDGDRRAKAPETTAVAMNASAGCARAQVLGCFRRAGVFAGARRRARRSASTARRNGSRYWRARMFPSLFRKARLDGAHHAYGRRADPRPHPASRLPVASPGRTRRSRGPAPARIRPGHAQFRSRQ